MALSKMQQLAANIPEVAQCPHTVALIVILVSVS